MVYFVIIIAKIFITPFLKTMLFIAARWIGTYCNSNCASSFADEPLLWSPLIPKFCQGLQYDTWRLSKYSPNTHSLFCCYLPLFPTTNSTVRLLDSPHACLAFSCFYTIVMLCWAHLLSWLLSPLRRLLSKSFLQILNKAT